MGQLIPLTDYIDPDTRTPWFAPTEPADWDPCHGCPVRGACREVRECQWSADTDPEPAIVLRVVGPPDIVA